MNAYIVRPPLAKTHLLHSLNYTPLRSITPELSNSHRKLNKSIHHNKTARNISTTKYTKINAKSKSKTITTSISHSNQSNQVKLNNAKKNIILFKHDPKRIQSKMEPNPNPNTIKWIQQHSTHQKSTLQHVKQTITFLNFLSSRTFTKNLREFPLQRMHWFLRSYNNLIATVHFSINGPHKKSLKSLYLSTHRRFPFWVFTRS